MATLTLEQFYTQYKEQHPDADKWENLEQHHVHKITSFRFVNTTHGETCIITLNDGRNFWGCSGLYNKLKNDERLPKWLVSEGKKQSNKSNNQYWSFKLIDV